MGRRSAGALSLARSTRLRRAAEIQVLFQRGNRNESHCFVALWHQRGEARRAAFAVSRRVGSAVARNRARRRLREAYRRCQAGLPEGVELVIVARGPSLTVSFNQLLQEMRQAFEAIAGRVAGPGRSIGRS